MHCTHTTRMYRHIGAAVQILIRINGRLLCVFPVCGVAERRILTQHALRVHLKALVAGAVCERRVWRFLGLRVAGQAQYVSATFRMPVDGQTMGMVSGDNQQRLVQLIPVSARIAISYC